jgi:hypothetical protein
LARRVCYRAAVANARTWESGPLSVPGFSGLADAQLSCGLACLTPSSRPERSHDRGIPPVTASGAAPAKRIGCRCPPLVFGDGGPVLAIQGPWSTASVPVWRTPLSHHTQLPTFLNRGTRRSPGGALPLHLVALRQGGETPLGAEVGQSCASRCLPLPAARLLAQL